MVLGLASLVFGVIWNLIDVFCWTERVNFLTLNKKNEVISPSFFIIQFKVE